MNSTNSSFTPGRRPRRRLLSFAGPLLVSTGAAAVVFAFFAALSQAVPMATAVPESAMLVRPAQDPHEQEPRDDVLDCSECVRGNDGWESVA